MSPVEEEHLDRNIQGETTRNVEGRDRNYLPASPRTLRITANIKTQSRLSLRVSRRKPTLFLDF